MSETPTPFPAYTREKEPQVPAAAAIPDFASPGIAEKRDISPEDEGNRRLFDKVARLVHRYSAHPMERDEQGEYVIPDEQVRSFLRHEVQELRQLDPLINLELLIRDGSIEPEKGSVNIGVYRLVSPTLKTLNDVYLGPNETDNFIEDLNGQIQKLLGQNKAHVLRSTFKGGIFALDFSEMPVNGDGTPRKAVEACVNEIQQIANNILLSHLKARQEALRKKYAALLMRMARQAEVQGEGGAMSLRSSSLTQDMLSKIMNNITSLNDIITNLSAGDISVDIAFGFDTLRTEKKEMYRSIWNAECAANVAAINLNGRNGNGNGNGNGHETKPKPHAKMRFFSAVDFMTESVRATRSLGQVLEDGEVKPEWKPFFNFNERTGYLQMQKKMINIYRRLDKYRMSVEYQSLSRQQRDDFDAKMVIFDAYYKKMNVVDVLKPFTVEHMDGYLEKITSHTTLVEEAEANLAAAQPDGEILRLILSDVSEALEVSIKDEFEGVVKTTRAGVKALMDAGENLVIFTDNIGFGALNQGSYEQSIQDLIDMLGITDEEWSSVEEGTTTLEALVRKKTALVEKNDAFVNSMLSIGDAGSRYLRHNEVALSHLFGGEAIINADGGDESVLIYRRMAGCNYPTNMDEVERELLKASTELRMRIAGVMGNVRFSPFTGGPEGITITNESREEFKRYIEWLRWAEEQHAAIKALNEQGKHEVKLKNSAPTMPPPPL